MPRLRRVLGGLDVYMLRSGVFNKRPEAMLARFFPEVTLSGWILRLPFACPRAYWRVSR